MADLSVILKLVTGLFDRNLAQSSAQIHRFKERTKKAGKDIDSLNKNIMNASSGLKGFAGSMSGLITKGNFLTAGLAAMGAVAVDTMRTFAEFETSLNKFQAVMGITDKEMKFFSNEAIRLGTATTKTAKEVADAFRMIAGRLPDLLDCKEVLVQVTEAAITLSEAADITVDEAGTALANALNQMGEDASQAERYVNAFASASRNGAGEIDYLAEAMIMLGNTSSSVGMSFEQTLAVFEILAANGVKATSAGRQLRGVIGTLEKGMDDNLKPSVVGLEKALENLGNKQLKVSDYFQMFGRENQSAARAMVESRTELIELTKAITGTKTAQEMAEKATKGLEASTKRLGSAWDALKLSMTEGTFLKATVDELTSLLRLTNMFVDKLGEMKRSMDSFKSSNKFIATIFGDTPLEAGAKWLMGTGNLSVANSDAQVQARAAAYEKQGHSQAKASLGHYQRRFDNLLNELLERYNPATGRNYTKNEAITKINLNKDKYFPEVYGEQSKFMNDFAKMDIRNYLTKLFKQKESQSLSKDTINGDLGSFGNNIEGKIAYLEDLLAKGLDLQTEFFVRGLKEQLEKDLNKEIKNEPKLEQITTHGMNSGNFLYAPMKIQPTTLKDLKDQRNGIIQLMNQTDDPKEYLKLKVRLEMTEDAIEDFKNGGMRIKGLDVSQAIPLNFDTKESVDNFKGFSNAASSVGTLCGALEELMSAMLGVGAASKAMAASMAVANFAASMAMMISTMIEKSRKSLTIWDWIAGIAAGTAACVTAAAQLSSIMKYADGGIVGGNSTVGDYNIARVNSGEMILNNHQQRNLFSLLNNGGGSSANNGGKVEFKIEGKQLVGVLNNYNSKRNKVL